VSSIQRRLPTKPDAPTCCDATSTSPARCCSRRASRTKKVWRWWRSPGRALELFPGKQDVFNLVPALRSARILDEFCAAPDP
jgi:hypothetical protein